MHRISAAPRIFGHTRVRRVVPLALLASLAAGACAEGPAPAPSAPTVAVVAPPPASTKDAGAVVPSSPAPAPLTAGGNEVLVEEGGTTDLFADEDYALRQAVTAWLTKNTPWTLIPAEDVERVRARTTVGEDPATGRACGRPMHAHDGFARAFGTYDGAEVTITCARDDLDGPNRLPCTLDVDVYRHAPGVTRDDAAFYDEAQDFTFAAPIDGPPTPASIRAAVAHLARLPSQDMAGILGGLAGAGARPIRTRSSVKASLWSSVDPTAPELDDALLAPARAALDRCFSPDQNQEMYLLALDDAGHVTRCEGRPWEAVPSRACVCDAMKRVAWPKGARRVPFDVVHEAKDTVVAPGVTVSAWTGSHTEAISTVRVEACLAHDPPPPKEVHIPMTFRIDDALHPADVKISWPGAFPSAAARACLEKVVRRATYPCASRGASQHETVSAMTVSRQASAPGSGASASSPSSPLR